MDQINHITRQRYNGQNQDDLRRAKSKNGFQSDEWLTFLQAKSLGLKIKKGSKGVSLFTVVKVYNAEKKQDEEVPKTFTVFNLEQTEGGEINA